MFGLPGKPAGSPRVRPHALSPRRQLSSFPRALLRPCPDSPLGVSTGFWGPLGSPSEDEEAEAQRGGPEPGAVRAAPVTLLGGGAPQPHQAPDGLPGSSPPGSASDSTQNSLEARRSARFARSGLLSAILLSFNSAGPALPPAHQSLLVHEAGRAVRGLKCGPSWRPGRSLLGASAGLTPLGSCELPDVRVPRPRRRCGRRALRGGAWRARAHPQAASRRGYLVFCGAAARDRLGRLQTGPGPALPWGRPWFPGLSRPHTSRRGASWSSCGWSTGEAVGQKHGRPVLPECSLGPLSSSRGCRAKATLSAFLIGSARLTPAAPPPHPCWSQKPSHLA